jgi:hypothetical protein
MVLQINQLTLSIVHRYHCCLMMTLLVLNMLTVLFWQIMAMYRYKNQVVSKVMDGGTDKAATKLP